MIRTVAIISCLIIALFLIPVQTDCMDISECEPDAESELCVVVPNQSQTVVAAESLRSLPAPNIKRHRAFTSVRKHERLFHLPARILNCVFRE